MDFLKSKIRGLKRTVEKGQEKGDRFLDISYPGNVSPVP